MVKNWLGYHKKYSPGLPSKASHSLYSHQSPNPCPVLCNNKCWPSVLWVPMVKNTSNLHMYMYAWITTLLGSTFPPSYSQKWQRIVLISIIITAWLYSCPPLLLLMPPWDATDWEVNKCKTNHMHATTNWSAGPLETVHNCASFSL